MEYLVFYDSNICKEPYEIPAAFYNGRKTVVVSNNIFEKLNLVETFERLIDYGRSVGTFMPWHKSRNPYNWIVAELLLRRTTRIAAQKAYTDLITDFPTWESLNLATQSDISAKIAWIGLGNQRSLHLKSIARIVVDLESPNFCDESFLLSLPGIGLYISEILLLYLCDEKRFPIDANIQRVLRRILGLPIPIGTRFSNPYQDPQVESIIKALKSQYQAGDLLIIHRTILYIAWEFCKLKPRYSGCPLKVSCNYFLHNEQNQKSG